MCRVLMTTPSFTLIGGVSAYCRSMSAHLKNVRFCTVGRRSLSESAAARSLRLARDLYEFVSLVRPHDIEIVHVNTSLGWKALARDSLLMVVSRMLGKKVILFIHGWDPECERFIRRYCRTLFALVFLRADAIIVLAQSFRNTLIEFGYAKNIHIASTVVDDAVFEHLPPNRPGAERNPSSCSLLFLGRIERAKGIFETLDAFSTLKQEYPCLALTIAGEGIDLKRARARVAQDQIRDVLFLGPVYDEQKRKTFEAADIYVLPSHREGLPITLLEAMAYGLPVVTSAVGGIRDLFVTGKMGIAVDARNPSRLASAIGKLVENASLRREIGEFNRSYAFEHFRASEAAGKLRRVYQEIAAQRVS